MLAPWARHPCSVGQLIGWNWTDAKNRHVMNNISAYLLKITRQKRKKWSTATMNFNVSFFKTSIFHPKNNTLQFWGLRLVTCVFHTTAAHTWPKFHLTLTKKWATVAKFEVRVTFNNESIQKIAKSTKSRQPNYKQIDTEPVLLFELNIFCSTSHYSLSWTAEHTLSALRVI